MTISRLFENMTHAVCKFSPHMMFAKQLEIDSRHLMRLFIKTRRKLKDSIRNGYRKLKFFWLQSNFWQGREVTAQARLEILNKIEAHSGLRTLETASPNSLKELQYILDRCPERENVLQRFPRAKVLLLGHAVDIKCFRMEAFGVGWRSGNLDLLNPPVKPAHKRPHWFLGDEILPLAHQLAEEYQGTVLTAACDRIAHGNPHQNRLDTVKEIAADQALYRLPDIVLINSGDYEDVFNVDVPFKKFFKILSEKKGEVDIWLKHNGLYRDENRWLHYIDNTTVKHHKH